MMNTTAGTTTYGMPIMFTQEQYDQILKLINKESGENGRILQNLHSGKVKGIGKELDGLNNLQHKMAQTKVVVVHLHNDIAKEEDLRLWHGRLGHAPDRVVKIIPNMKFQNSDDKINECTICTLVRQGRLPFPKSTNRETAVVPNGLLDSSVVDPNDIASTDTVATLEPEPEDSLVEGTVSPAVTPIADGQTMSPPTMSLEETQLIEDMQT
ncbi:hypothetical protein A4A49_03649 [Nicotiana attenuata]|uniref:GAG-pre-integrase domain-containing protein n=1 Tax=Nicotiana attenuata TaxID=49451 RepID=A0A1J6IEZ8_NICAT|nr:hypothetical protein A4A49_03649 [Nicotiana attenuata]